MLAHDFPYNSSNLYTHQINNFLIHFICLHKQYNLNFQKTIFCYKLFKLVIFYNLKTNITIKMYPNSRGTPVCLDFKVLQDTQVPSDSKVHPARSATRAKWDIQELMDLEASGYHTFELTIKYLDIKALNLV